MFEKKFAGAAAVLMHVVGTAGESVCCGQYVPENPRWSGYGNQVMWDKPANYMHLYESRNTVARRLGVCSGAKYVTFKSALLVGIRKTAALCGINTAGDMRQAQVSLGESPAGTGRVGRLQTIRALR